MRKEEVESCDVACISVDIHMGTFHKSPEELQS